MKNVQLNFTSCIMSILIFTMTFQLGFSQQVDIEGKLKITDMTSDNTQENLVVRNLDGTLGTRSVSSLPPPSMSVDSTRNLASDFDLANYLCQCGTSLPPFLIESLLNNGYTNELLLEAGVPFSDLPFTCGDIFIDERNDKTYNTKLIGTQCWMTENLDIGNMITGVSEMTDNSVIEKYCFQDNPANCEIYGGLYQWQEMMAYQTTMNQGVCPTDWHIATDDELKTLEIELGMTQVEADNVGFRGTNEGSKLAGNDVLWNDGILDQNSDFGTSGFSVLPGGYRAADGVFFQQLDYGYYWSSSQNGGTSWFRNYVSNQIQSYRSALNPALGFSVRCVQD